jgi:sulfoxide reductase heme-binding subunit YedZ
LAPAVWLIVSYFFGRLTANPVQDLERRSGDTALAMLMLSLACTPLRLITGRTFFMPMRRSFGLFAFAYAAAHFLLFIGLDYGWNWDSIRSAFSGRLYLWFGLAALAILLLLAVTSITTLKVILAKNWQRVHSLTYAAGILVLVHFTLSIKGNLSSFSGNYAAPVWVAVLLVLLLGIRFAPIRALILHLRGKIHSVDEKASSK